MIFTRNTPLKVCIQLRDSVFRGTNTRIGEYICLPPHIADAQARTGNVAVVTSTLRSADVKAAGGWRKLLAGNRKLRAMDEGEEKRINKQLEKWAPPKSTAVQDEALFAPPSVVNK